MSPGQPGQGSPQGRGFGNGNLSKMEVTGKANTKVKWQGMKDDWTRLKKNLDDKILQAKGHVAPREYRDLIKRYFEARAKAQAKAAGEKD